MPSGYYPEDTAPAARAPTIPPQAGKTYRMRNGETVGPMRFRGNDEDQPWLGLVDTGLARLYRDDGRHYNNNRDHDIIAEITPDADAPTAEGPVRHRTVTEIVPGTYGFMRVSNAALAGRVGICVHNCEMDAGHLRAAAAVMIALADGLDEMAAK